MPDSTQVVIAGGGPVGLALAVDLGLRGISCVLIERNREIHEIPKGQNLAQRTLENFWFWGIAEKLRAARVMPASFPNRFVIAYGDLASEFWYTPATRAVVDEYYFQQGDRLPQYLTEQVLIDRLCDLPQVTVKRGWSVLSINQDSDGVAVTLREWDDGNTETLRADYVVGCDGSHSLVRRQLGLASTGTDYEQRMVLAVFRSDNLDAALKHLPRAIIYRVVHRDLNGFWRFFGRVDERERWFFHAPVDTGADLREDSVRKLLWQAAGANFDCSFDHIGYWDLRVSIAERFRAGRVFLAGDAAHSHPPYGGYGLNTGIDDAANLGWKLAAFLAGWGGEALLESYDEERRPVAMETSEQFIDQRIARDRDFFHRYNPDSDRKTFARMWKQHRTSGHQRMLDYAPHYEGSPVIAGAALTRSGARGAHSHRARAGHHLTPWPLSSGHNVFEELGPGFTLIAPNSGEEVIRAFETEAHAAALPLKVIRDHQQKPAMILVRPDRHIAWTGSEMPGNISELLAQVTGRNQ